MHRQDWQPLDASHPAPVSNRPALQMELAELLGRMKQHLSLEQWQAVELVYVNNLSPALAAQQGGCELPVFYNRLSRARKKILELLKRPEEA